MVLFLPPQTPASAVIQSVSNVYQGQTNSRGRFIPVQIPLSIMGPRPKMDVTNWKQVVLSPPPPPPPPNKVKLMVPFQTFGPFNIHLLDIKQTTGCCFVVSPGGKANARRPYHNLQSSVLRNVDHFVALNVPVGWTPADGESRDGWVGHSHGAHAAQRHWEGGEKRHE